VSYRSFRDSLGVIWQVWETVPRDEVISGAFVPDSLLRGLVFETIDEKRLLGIVPPGWWIASDGELEAMLLRGTVVIARSRPTPRVMKYTGLPSMWWAPADAWAARAP